MNRRKFFKRFAGAVAAAAGAPVAAKEHFREHASPSEMDDGWRVLEGMLPDYAEWDK